MKEGCLFFSYEIHQAVMLQIVVFFGVFGKSSQQGGVHGLGSMVLVFLVSLESSLQGGVHGLGSMVLVFLVSLESSQQGGVHGLGSMVFGLGVRKFLNIE
jgi:hypothetical protein